MPVCRNLMLSGHVRVAVVQFSPLLGQVQANLQKARDLCKQILPRSIDLLCFPEMALTGYTFPSAQAITPFLEQPKLGTTSQFCAEMAKKLGCYVVSGYPEKLEPHEVDQANGLVGANSAIIYDPEGEWVGGYRKTNLYTADKPWSIAGTGYGKFTLPPPLNNVTLAICMDLNPLSDQSWSIENGPYEVADHCLANKTNLLILLNAWLYSNEDSEEHEGKNLAEEPCWSTLNYWALRLRPLWMKNSAHEGSEKTVVVVCNRSGAEDDTSFAGSSSLFLMERNSGKPKLVDMMTKDEEGVRIWDIPTDDV